MDKNISYSIFGIIGILIIVGTVLVITQNITGYGLYSGSLRIDEDPYPLARGRTVKAGVREVAGYDTPVPVSDSMTAYEYTGYGIYKRRYPGRIFTTLTSCSAQARLNRVPKDHTIEMSLTEAIDTFGYQLQNYCTPAPHFEGKYCCVFGSRTTYKVY